MNEILREIEEDLRREQMNKIWKKYGQWLLWLIVLVIASTIGIVWWQHESQRQQEERAQLFYQIQQSITTNSAADIEPAVAVLQEKEDGYAILSKMVLAQSFEKQEKFDSALDVYKNIINTSNLHDPYRQLAVVRFSLLVLQLPNAEQSLITEAVTLLNSTNSVENVFYWTSRELEVFYALKQGQFVEAKQKIIAVVDSPNVPVGMRRRLTELLKTL
ncbi:MAG: tetratricopeptide repeat protein [Alphaproteobacteria bacterium]|nr:tetratricopeptide repeat protein [Alphaproteobacteria bacterium]